VGLGSGSGLYPPTQWRMGLERGMCSLAIKFFDFFLSGNGALWCILGACFNVSIRRVKQESKSSFLCQLPICQLSHMADVSSMISYA